MRIAISNQYRQPEGWSKEMFWSEYAFPVPNDFDFAKNNCTEVFEVKAFYEMWNTAKRFDYLVFRDSCKQHFTEQSVFDSLTEENKKLLVKYNIYPVGTNLDLYYHESEQLVNWAVLAAITRPEREKRIEACRQEISWYLNAIDATDLLMSVLTYMQAYEIGQTPHLILWLTNGEYAPMGIDFTNNGFAQKSYYSESLKTLCVEVITNGNYRLYTEKDK